VITFLTARAQTKEKDDIAKENGSVSLGWIRAQAATHIDELGLVGN